MKTVRIYRFSWLWFNFSFAEKWNDLSPAQQHKLREALFKQCNPTTMRIVLVLVCLNYWHNPFSKFILSWLLKAPAFHQLIPEIEWILKPDKEIMMKSGNWHKNDMKFIQFIRINENLSDLANTENEQSTQEQLVANIIAARYVAWGQQFDDSTHATRAGQAAALPFEIKQHLLNIIIAEHNEIVRMYPHVFPKKQDSERRGASASWLHILRELSPDITKQHEVAYLDAYQVLFDFENRIIKAQREQEELDRLKKK
jgi:hypothetical protein